MSVSPATHKGVFIWADYFKTGLGEVDEQHFKLVELVNQLGERLASGRPLTATEIEHVLGGLHKYAKLHFTTEEETMLARGIDRRHYDIHVHAHAEFAAQVETLAVAAANGQGNLLSELMQYVSSWLVLHILGIDMSMARQLQAIEKGVAAADAYENDARAADPANRALIAAIHTLYSTVAQRNVELIKAKAELEDRVAERTADLQEAVAHLEAAKEEIVQSEKMAALGQFAAGMAHELNTPLGFIGGNVNALGDYCAHLLQLSESADALIGSGSAAAAWKAACERADRDFVREDVPQLLAESRNGLDRIHRIVDALHRSAGGIEDAPAPTALKTIIDEVVEQYRATTDAEVRFECACDPALMALVSRHGIALAIDEMLDNAVKALNGKGGVIRCSTGSNATQMWIEIEDNGPGVSSAIAQHVFEPFFTTRAVGSGAGLGLYLAYQAARQHRGYVELRHSGPGAAFRLVLPAMKA